MKFLVREFHVCMKFNFVTNCEMRGKVEVNRATAFYT